MAEHNDYDKITRQAGETAENRNKADPGKEKTSSTRSRWKKTLRVGGYSVLACLMVLAICVAVNILADKLPTSVSSLDLSSNKVYSLSDESRDLVKGLDEDVTIYWLVQNGKEDVPVKNILDRYESAGKHITVKRIDPDVYPNFAEQYSVSGTVYNNSLVIEKGNASRYIPYQDMYSSSANSSSMTFAGESEITAGLRYVTSGEHPVIYNLTGHGEAVLEGTFRSSVEGQNFTVTNLSLLSEGAVPQDGAFLFINTPSTDISAEEKEMILDYLKTGGKLLLVTDVAQDGSEFNNIREVMAFYGVTSENGIVLEQSPANYASNMPYFLLPDLDAAHAVSAPLANGGYRVLLPIAQGLTVGDAPRESVSVSKLMTTSDSAFSKASWLEMTTYEKEEGDTDGPFALAVAVSEPVENGETDIVWISSGAILDETVNEQVSGGNQDFFLNAVTWLYSNDEEGGPATTIHAKAFDYGHLTMSSAVGSALAVLMILVIPLGCILAGIVVRSRRKRR